MEWKEQGRKSSQSVLGQIFMRSGVGPISLLDGSAGFADKGSVWIRWTLISLWHLISLPLCPKDRMKKGGLPSREIDRNV